MLCDMKRDFPTAINVSIDSVNKAYKKTFWLSV